jgi:hypothetical protein
MTRDLPVQVQAQEQVQEEIQVPNLVLGMAIASPGGGSKLSNVVVLPVVELAHPEKTKIPRVPVGGGGSGNEGGSV